jgi:hypothetical protein
MVKYLIATTETYRIDNSEVDLKEFQEWLQEDAKRKRYTVTAFSYQERKTKDDEWLRVRVTKAFNEEKCPDLPLKEIVYQTYEVQFDNEDDGE